MNSATSESPFVESAAATTPVAPLSTDRPIHVVHLVLTLNIGGLEKVVYDLARCADRRRFSVSVLCLGEIGELGPAFEEIGVPAESLGVHGKGTLRGVIATARRLRELQPDVLHTHNGAPHLIGAPAARWSGVPVIIHTRHGEHCFHGGKSILGNWIATSLTNRMIAVSGATAHVARARDRVAERKLEIIRNGVDLDVYRQSERRDRNRCLRAIHAARLNDPVKDQRTLLRAVRLVADTIPDFHLDIVGDGPDRVLLEGLTEELNLRSHVTFLGCRHDVPELLRRADVFILSSVTEGLPMTLLEAMAAGLPIVATDVGGISELVRRDETGLLVPPQSPQSLAAAILTLVGDPQCALRMGQSGRRRVEEEFDLRRVVEKYETHYCQLLHAANA